MNQIETWFGILSRTALERGSFEDVRALVAAIDGFHPCLGRRRVLVPLGQDR